MRWPRPYAKDIQIRTTPGGKFSVKVRSGWEQTDDEWFALILWHAAWTLK